MTETFDVFTPPPGAPPGMHIEYPPAPAPPSPSAPPAAAAPAMPGGAHTMPSGAWVLLWDPRTLTRGDKKELIRAAKDLDGVELLLAIPEIILTRLISAWSYPFPIPAEDPSSIDRIPIEDDEPITDLIDEARALLFPGTATPDDHADERSPTGPSGE